MTVTDLTMPQVLRQLQTVYAELAQADRDLRNARDAEVSAAEGYRLAKAKAFLADECPQPRRGENGVTVADRDAWVDRRCTPERELARGTEAVRKAAEDHLRVVRDQASLVQTIAGLMRAEMTMSHAAYPHAG